MSVTKTQLPRQSIHQLTGGVAWPSGCFPNDIIDVCASLGKSGTSIFLNATNGEIGVRFDVTQKIFGRQDPYGRFGPPYVTYAEAEFYDRPMPSGEIEVEKDTITVTSGTTFAIDNFHFDDFKIVTLGSGAVIVFQ